MRHLARLLLVSAALLVPRSAPAALLYDCPLSPQAATGDLIDRAFYVTAYPGVNLTQVVLYLQSEQASEYAIQLNALAGTFDGALIGSATANVSIPTSGFVTATFSFPSPAVTPGSTVAFTIVRSGGPRAAIFFAVDSSNGSCPIVETEDATPPLSTKRRDGIAALISGDLVVPVTLQRFTAE